MTLLEKCVKIVKNYNEGGEKMANPDNLIMFGSRPKEVERAIQSKGGTNAGIVNKKRKKQRELVQIALDMPICNIKKLSKLAKQLGIDADECSLQWLLTIKLLVNTLVKGDLKDIKILSEILGENVGDSSFEDIEKVIVKIREKAQNNDK